MYYGYVQGYRSKYGQDKIISHGRYVHDLEESEAQPMPVSPNAAGAARRSTAPVNNNVLNFGKQFGQHDTTDARTKVREWQVEGGGVLPTNDKIAVTELSDKITKSANKNGTPRETKLSKSAPTTPAKTKTSKEIDAEKQAWIRRRSNVGDKLDDDTKRTCTPKKRVVSDGHWRKDRTPTQKSDAIPEIVPKPYVVQRTYVYEESKGNVKDEKKDVPKLLRTDDGKRIKPQQHNSQGISEERPLNNNGTGERRREQADDRKSWTRGKENHDDNSDDSTRRNSKRHSHRQKSRTTQHDDHVTEAEESLSPRDSISMRDGHNHRIAASPAMLKRRLISKTTSQNLTEEQKPFHHLEDRARPIPLARPQVFGTRIEAWLGDFTDPFLEDKDKALPDHGASKSGIREAARNRDEQPRTRSRKYDGHYKRSDEITPPSTRQSSLDRRNQEAFADSPRSPIKRKEVGSPVRNKSPAFTGDNITRVQQTMKDNTKRKTFRSTGAVIDEDGVSVTSSSTPPIDADSVATPTRKHAPGTNSRRQFPSTGKRLSTIASVETFNVLRSRSPADNSHDKRGYEIRSLDHTNAENTTSLKRRLTRHEDLLSVLSLPRDEHSGSIVSARSIRTTRSRLTPASTTQEIWNDFVSAENKYNIELRTLVDGVIPVLLSCVLSRSNSTGTSGLFEPSQAHNAAITQPIVEMGVALERLRSHHKRVPKDGDAALLSWAQVGIRIYTDYLKVWKLGFQDVVINLAPAEHNGKRNFSWEKGLPRNSAGDLLDSDGERVDVAFLLKRPLVRLKYLARTFSGFNLLAPSSQASSLAKKYQELLEFARTRANQERARLEDEAAASIDPTRSRDPRSLGPLAGVSIDATRYVRARDYFDMNLLHSSGQEMDCKIELVLRDDAPERGTGGDLLLCEISDTGRWLLFPPIRKDLVSARNGDQEGEVVIMIRGMLSNRQEWHELLKLDANETEAASEWVEMLGSSPLPPGLQRRSSLLPLPLKTGRHRNGAAPSSSSHNSPTSPKHPSRTPLMSELDVPIGERPLPASGRRRFDAARIGPESSLDDGRATTKSNGTYNKPEDHEMSTTKSFTPSESQWSGAEYAFRPGFARTESESTWSSNGSSLSGHKKDYSVWLPSSDFGSDVWDEEADATIETGHRSKNAQTTPSRRLSHRRTSSGLASGTTLDTTDDTRSHKMARSNKGTNSSDAEDIVSEPKLSTSAPAKLQKSQKSNERQSSRSSPDSPTPKQHKRFSIPSLTPAFLRKKTRPSSPLKHEYEPSSVTESSSESDFSGVEDDASDTSDSETEENRFSSAKSPDPVLPTQYDVRTLPDSLPSSVDDTLVPSQSASQSPYRAVPYQSGTGSKAVATVFSWCEHGAWENLHPEECSIVVTPGLIEAFDMVAAQSNTPSDQSDLSSPSTRGISPLVAFELTPLVPLRRGTALDITIRSPATANSLIRTSQNVMFRSRSPEDCEALYAMINTARINNPTYIALQNARGPFNEGTWAAAMDRRNEARTTSSSWFNLPTRRKSTYRSKASRLPSLAATDSSIGTMNTAFSALRRFSGNNRFFNIGKSTITSHQGSRSGTSDSLSSGTSTPFTLDPSMGTPIGITNTKIRFYIRETSTRWRDLGSARLTITLPPRINPNAPASPRNTEKRIVVAGKTKGEILLDVTLGESCFERVARTGIAVSVWEENMGPNGEMGRANAVGGVASSRSRTYMVQMKSERDCAYTFGLVGKFRY